MSISLFSVGPRQLPRIKFIWRSNRIVARWRLGVVGFYERVDGYPDSGLAISCRGVLLWSLGLGVAGYLALAGVLTWWFDRQPHNVVKFADVVAWPVRRERMQRLRGECWLAQGRDEIQAKNIGAGVFLLRRGLEARPDAWDVRLLLAQIFVGGGDRVRGIALLADAPQFGLPPPTWIESACSMMEAGEDWASMLRLCEGGLARAGGQDQWRERQQLLARKLSALRGLGRLAEALRLAEAAGDQTVLSLRLERARLLIGLGRAEEAANVMTRWRTAVSDAEMAGLLRMQAEAWREARRYDDMEQTLTELRARNPARADLAAFTVEQQARAGRGASGALEDFIQRFGGTSANLMRLASGLAELPDVALLRRVVAAAREHGFPAWPFEGQLATALFQQGPFEELPPLLASINQQVGTAAESREWQKWSGALATALLSPDVGAQSQVVAIVNARLLGLPHYKVTIVALRRAERWATAREVVNWAKKFYPESPWLRQQADELSRAIAAMTVAAPSVEAIKRVATPGEIEFYAELERLSAAGCWADAQQLIRKLRVARPPAPWLAAREVDLLRHEIRVDQAADDRPALVLALRLFLNGDAGRADEMLAFAQELKTRGAPADARLVAATILEKIPGHAEANDFLNPPSTPAEPKR